MMNYLYKKNELFFALVWIVIYVFSLSVSDSLSAYIGTEKSITMVVSILLSFVIFIWMKHNDLLKKYGLCRPEILAERLLYYIPMAVMASVNLWYGVTYNLSIIETVFYIVSMFLVGFLEEVIFRGLLFKAMCRDNVKIAIVVSSVTFGIGHIVNLINGSGMDVFSNLLQVGYAVAGGFLFTIFFYKTKSLLPCILTHGVLNALSVFADQSAVTPLKECFSAVVLAGVAFAYAVYLLLIGRGSCH